jgi:hypothetical protein
MSHGRALTLAPRPGTVERLMTSSELAEALRLSPAWVRKHASCADRPARPTIRALRIGRKVLFREEDVRQFLGQHKPA